MISIFLAEGMDILLDAEDLLRKWREHPSERQELSSLLDELTTLAAVPKNGRPAADRRTLRSPARPLWRSGRRPPGC